MLELDLVAQRFERAGERCGNELRQIGVDLLPKALVFVQRHFLKARGLPPIAACFYARWHNTSGYPCYVRLYSARVRSYNHGAYLRELHPTMNFEQLKKNVNQRVRLRPMARRFDEHGRELETKDDVWVVQSVTDALITLSNERTGHCPSLGKDHVYGYASDPGRTAGGVKHGFLTLHVQ